MSNYKKLKKEYNHAYENLYIEILKIGSKFVNRGISYNELQAILQEKGYDFTLAGIEPAVKQWFFDSFHHTGTDDRPCKHVSDLDKYEHLDCHFMLKGAYCLKLVDHEISQKNARTTWLAILIAVTIPLLAIIIDKSFGGPKAYSAQLKNMENKISHFDSVATSRPAVTAALDTNFIKNIEAKFLQLDSTTNPAAQKAHRDTVINLTYHYYIIPKKKTKKLPVTDTGVKPPAKPPVKQPVQKPVLK